MPMKRILWGLPACFWIIIQCAPPPPVSIPHRPREEPAIRVGLTWGQTRVVFSLEKDGVLSTPEQNLAIRGGLNEKWAVSVSGGTSKDRYRLVAASMSTRSGAETMSREINQKGYSNFIQEINHTEAPDGSKRLYRIVLSNTFSTHEEARRVQERVQRDLNTFIIQEGENHSAEKLVMTHLSSGRTITSKGPMTVSGTNVIIDNLDVGKGFHWQGRETRVFPEKIIFTRDSRGMLAVINRLPIETYLKGVLPSEMPHGFPMEALKAQAIAARSEALFKTGRAHSNEPFDICADVHCQVYSGLSRNHEKTDKAVLLTRGLVLFYDGSICDAVYSAMCGGHTENNEAVWGGKPQPYLRGVPDGPSRLRHYGSLAHERNIRRWIDSEVSAFCNSPRYGSLPALEYTKKYHRWEVQYDQKQLQTLIARQTGQFLGDIQRLKVLKRGVSGRILSLRIEGSRSSLVLNKELSIRKALSSNTLWSSCFYVTEKNIRGGIPQLFILKGAGFGHGVGMCQTGAAIMALNGKSFSAILTHYYHGTRIRRMY
ncbi:MAG TPA: SpoIID/LytB domain-containing protein [bacterium]|nr:SpoIID/LytB domain-containing protein [bacterium]